MPRMKQWTSGKANGCGDCENCGADLTHLLEIHLEDGEDTYFFPEGTQYPECKSTNIDDFHIDGIIHHEREDFHSDL